ncbi:MAG: GumC family protein, partial [Hyphomicrobium sp.]
MQGSHEQFEDEVSGGGALSLDRALSAVRKRLKLVAIMPVIAALIMTAVVMMMTNRYDASAIVQIDPRHKSVTNIENVLSEVKTDTTGVESEVEIIKSRPIILKVIDVLDLRNDPEFAKPPLTSRLLAKLGLGEWAPAVERTAQRPRDPIADMLKVDEPGASKPKSDEVADAFMQKLKVIRVRNTLLIDIRVSASEATKAARIANTLAEAYIKDQLDTKMQANATATALLEERIDSMRIKVSEAERKVEQWKAQHNVFDTEGQVLSEKQLTRLMEQAVTARSATAEAQAKYDQAQKLASTGDSMSAIAEVLQSNSIRVLKDQLASARRKAAELQTKYGPKHPEMLKVNAEAALAEKQITTEIGRLVASLKNDAEVAADRERQLAQNMTQLQQQQVSAKVSSTELNDLEREAATSKQLLETLLTRY